MISGAAVASKGAQNGHDIYNYDTNYTYNPFATVGSSSFSPSKDKRPRGNYRSRPYKNVRQSYTTRKPKSSENNNPQISETPSPAEALILKHQSLREEDYKYLVCDTNIWIKHLRIITALLNDEKMVEYKLYIPHMERLFIS